jgi:hypothetical protein
VNADEDTHVDTEPLRVRGATISTPVVAREATNLDNDALYAHEIKRQRYM